MNRNRKLYLYLRRYQNISATFKQNRPRGYKLFSCWTQLSMKISLLINMKMPTMWFLCCMFCLFVGGFVCGVWFIIVCCSFFFLLVLRKGCDSWVLHFLVILTYNFVNEWSVDSTIFMILCADCEGLMRPEKVLYGPRSLNLTALLSCPHTSLQPIILMAWYQR